MIVVNERGWDERNLDSAFGGENFNLIIVFDDEKIGIPPDRLNTLMEHLWTGLYPDGRIITAKESEGYGVIPRGSRQHSWIRTVEAIK